MISIVIPVHNNEDTIEKCIRSILNQTYKDIEVLFMDDESTDGTLSVVNSIQDSRLRVFPLKKEHPGCVWAYMRGIQEAKGEYLCMVDGDDYLNSDYLEHLLLDMTRENVDLVTTGVHQGDTYVTNDFKTGKYEFRDLDLICTKALRNQYFAYCVRWNKIYKTEKVRRILPKLNPDLRQREDNVFCYLYYLECKNVYIDNECFGYNQTVNPYSMSRKKNSMIWEQMEVTSNYLLSISNNRKEVARLTLDNVFYSIGNYIDHSIPYKEVKSSIKDMLKNPLVKEACSEKRMYSKKERVFLTLIQFKNAHLLYSVYRFAKKKNQKAKEKQRNA